jgi:hypothetical protein
MIRYTVVWLNTARDELARLWIVSIDKQALTDAANQLDRQLAIDPDTFGMLVREQLYECSFPPLRVLFRLASRTAS